MSTIDYFLKTYDVHSEQEKVILDRKKSINGLLWVVAILIVIASCVFIFSSNIIFSLTFIVVDLIVLAILWVNNQHIIYPKTVIDFQERTFTRYPALSFLQPKVKRIDSVKGIDLSVKAVGGYASPFHEGNTDYLKAIILILEEKEYRIFDYISRREALEKSAENVVNKIREGLLPSSVGI